MPFKEFAEHSEAISVQVNENLRPYGHVERFHMISAVWNFRAWHARINIRSLITRTSRAVSFTVKSREFFNYVKLRQTTPSLWLFD